MIVVGLSHRTAPIGIRERIAVGGDALESLTRRIHSLMLVDEAMVLSTCNRLEVYAACDLPDVDAHQLAAPITEILADVGGPQVVPFLATHVDQQAILHLFRVASSLDSMVVGEPQILGQVKDALHLAERLGTVGAQLHAALHGALHVAKRVRNETTIGAGQASVPSVAITLARQIFDELAGRVALLVGAGEMAETAARHLARAGAQVLVVNRSAARAARLATTVGGSPHSWDELEQALIRADIVVTSTASPDHVITRRQLKRVQRARRNRSLFLIDIAVPRDVDPAVLELEQVYLYDIDDLTRVVAQTIDGRVLQAEAAEGLVREEASQFERRQTERAMAPLIVALRERTLSTLQRELGRSLRGRLRHLGDEERQALEVMLEAAVGKLWHEPTVRLKAAAAHPNAVALIHVVSDLFALDEEPASLGLEALTEPPVEHGTPSPTDESQWPHGAPRTASGSPANVQPSLAPGPSYPPQGDSLAPILTPPPISQPLVDLDSVDELDPPPEPEPESEPGVDPVASLREPRLPREFRTPDDS